AHTHTHTHHNFHVSNTLQSVVHPPCGHLDQDLLHASAVVSRVHALSHAKLSRLGKLFWVHVHADDPTCPRHHTPHHCSQTHSSQDKHRTYTLKYMPHTTSQHTTHTHTNTHTHTKSVRK